MRWKIGSALLAVAVVALVIANLSMRENPEPVMSSPPAVTERPNPVRRFTWTSDMPAEGETDRDPAASAEETTEDVDAIDELRSVDCEHPYVPSTLGTTRTYRWTQSDQARSARLELTALGAHEDLDHEPAVGWRARVVAEDDESQLGVATLFAACRPGIDAEEPWFGILERSLGLSLADSADRWRWPNHLTPGVRFEGTARFDPTESEMRPAEGVVPQGTLQVTRRHTVRTQQPIEVPAGRFDAWRVEYEETQEYGGHGETGTGALWVAENIGLVRAEAENSQGVTQIIELIAYRNP